MYRLYNGNILPSSIKYSVKEKKIHKNMLTFTVEGYNMYLNKPLTVERSDKMYRELLGEMMKRGITRKQLAKKIGISDKTIRNKISGRTDFNWSEVQAIRDIVAPDFSIEELFKKDVEQLNM